MGCLFSSPYSPFYYIFSKAPGNQSFQQQEEQPKVYSWDTRPKIDPKDYSIENKNGETIYKLPGTINGNQFIIQNLENCLVYLFDHISQITIDDCKNCKFFIGPTRGSIFIRDCSDCNFALICQQFRTRDCKKLNTFLLCSTQPIIESSTYMKFGCISIDYDLLNEHLKSANISIFNNNWNNIHDFTSVPGEPNFSFLNKSFQMEDYINFPNADVANKLNLSFSKFDSIIPYTLGTSFRPINESCLVVFFRADTIMAASHQESNARNFISEIIKNHRDLSLVQTKQYILSDLSAENVFGSKKFNSHLEKKPIIGVEINGDNCSYRCQNIIQSLRIDLTYISQPSQYLTHQIDNFYNFADIQMAV